MFKQKWRRFISIFVEKNISYLKIVQLIMDGAHKKSETFESKLANQIVLKFYFWMNVYLQYTSMSCTFK